MSDKNYLGYNVERLETAPSFLPYSKVIAWYDDENAFVAGDDSGRVLTVDLPFATQTIVDKMLERIKGYSYQPWTGSGAILDPAAELGDGVTVNGVYSVLASAETSFDALMVSDAAAPADEEVDHEYPHLSATDRALKRKVTLGAAYHGVSITRANGIEVTRYDAEGNAQSRAKLNGDVFAMYDDDGTARIYFDTETGRYKFYGDLDISGGSINLSGGSIKWGGNNPAAGKLDEDDLPDYLHRTYIDETTVKSPTIVGGTIRATDDSKYYAEMQADTFALMGEDNDTPRAAITASKTMVELSLGVGDEEGNGRFYVRKGYGSVNDSATQNFALLQFNDVNGGNSMIVFTDNDGILVDADPIAFYGTVDLTNATVLGLTASGGEGLSGETVKITATKQVRITANDDINVQSDEDVNFAADYDIVFSAIQSNDKGERVSMRLSADYQRIHFSIGRTVWVLDETGLWKL